MRTTMSVLMVLWYAMSVIHGIQAVATWSETTSPRPHLTTALVAFALARTYQLEKARKP